MNAGYPAAALDILMEAVIIFVEGNQAEFSALADTEDKR